MPRNDFVLEAFVDFPDDTLIHGRALTAIDIDAMMARLAAMGIKRVSWGYYGDGQGGMPGPETYATEHNGGWKYYEQTYRTLGSPLKIAVEAGHRHGLEVYGYFKPYETGAAVLFPAGSREAAVHGGLDHIGGRLAWMYPFVRDNPGLRVRRRRDDLPHDVTTRRVCALRLIKSDAGETRITREHLQVWTSEKNWKYERVNTPFELTQSVEKSKRDVRDNHGRLLTRRGDDVRVLTLTGLALDQKFILLTTDFSDTGGFTNSGTAILEALDEHNQLIPGVFATGGTVWGASLVDFRNAGLTFDYGWGAHPVTLDTPNSNGKSGFIAFARGRNEFLPGALCETEPAVRAFWLKCLDIMIDAGVDGVDFREENHSTHTDFPEEYGYNDVVLAHCDAQSGGLSGEALRQKIAAVRGDAYTEFLRACKQRLAGAGKKMRYNLQADFFRADPPAERLLAYPLNLDFQWQRWIREGLMDAAILRSYSLPGKRYSTPMQETLADPIVGEMIRACKAARLPITVNRYVTGAGEANLSGEVKLVRNDGRFAGFIFYETYDFLALPAEGRCEVSAPWVAAAAAVV